MAKLPVSFAETVAMRPEEAIKQGMAYWLEELQAGAGLVKPYKPKCPLSPKFKKGSIVYKATMQGCSFELKLPADHPPTAVGAMAPAGQCVSAVPRTVAEAVRQLAAEMKATEFVVLLAAYGVLLYRYCQQDDILIGVPVSTRQTGEASLVGDFVNTTAIRLDFSAMEGGTSPGGPCIRTVLEEVQARLLGALEHCHVPWQLLVKEPWGAKPVYGSEMPGCMFALPLLLPLCCCPFAAAPLLLPLLQCR